MTPVEALERVLHCLDRAHTGGFKTKAFARALDVVRAMPEAELVERAENGSLTRVDGIGDATAAIVTDALRGEMPPYLEKLERTTQITLSPEAAPYRAALRGDVHLHSTWSDGGASTRRMAETARALGHEYIVLTDHSARLTIAHGLDRGRLLAQLDELAELNRELSPFRVLTGMEVDILEDGSLDLDDDLLAALDFVVASVHSKLRMEAKAMTRRMVAAASSPHVDALGHCTGRLIGKRPQSSFDADAVFAACAANCTAVEINSRPERLDPPRELLDLALTHDCYLTIASDAHATGQLEWQPHGCERAVERGVPIEAIVNTWSAEALLDWAGS